MNAEARSVGCVISWRRDWAPHLFSFRTTRPAGIAFAPGQFVRLGVSAADGTMVWRAYSIASAPDDDYLEFYSIVVPDGPFTQPLALLGVGDPIRIDPTVYGFLRTDRFVGGEHLWLLATGTGIAPYLSILSDPGIGRRFRDVVVVHSVRRSGELAYRDTIAARIAAQTATPDDTARLHYLPTLTGERGDDPEVLRGRITELLSDGTLEGSTGLPISTEASRIMICGNPSMIKDTRALLGARGLSPVRRETPGQYIAENFW